MPRFLIELVKHIQDATQPLALVAFLAVVTLGFAWLFLRGLPGLLRIKPPLDRRQKFILFRQIISSLFWLSLAVCVLGFGLDFVVQIYKLGLPKALPDITEPAKPPTTPANPPLVTPNPPPPVVPIPPSAQSHQYKLIWYNHYKPNTLWEVTKRADVNISDVRNDLFQSWCIPFEESKYEIYQRRLVAADEEFKETQNWWVAPPYDLPALNKRWLEIMDDERWYFYEVSPK